MSYINIIEALTAEKGGFEDWWGVNWWIGRLGDNHHFPQPNFSRCSCRTWIRRRATRRG
jgi:hypothetical protein